MNKQQPEMASQGTPRTDVMQDSSYASPERHSPWFGYALWGTLGIAVILLALLFVIAARQTPRAAHVNIDPSTASALVALSPEVMVKSSEDTSFRPVTEETAIQAGTEIQTRESGQALILSPEGIFTVLKENTHVRVDELDNTESRSRLSLLSGGLWARVEKVFDQDEYYEVQVGDVVTSVRGTEFEIDNQDGEAALTVLRDEVALVSTATGENNTTAQEVLRVLSGERLRLSTTSGVVDQERVESLSRDEIASLVASHAQVDEVFTHPRLRRLVAAMEGRPHPEADDQERLGSLELLGESVRTALVRDERKKAEYYLLRAEERLAEAQSLAADDSRAAMRAIDHYRALIARVQNIAEESDDSELQERVAKSTLAQQSVLTAVLEEVPEEARAAVKQARAVAQTGFRGALNALASTSPDRAFALSGRAVKEYVRDAQREAAFGDNLDLGEALREYDRVMRIGAEISEREPDDRIRHRFAETMRRTLASVETVDTFGPTLSPGLERSIDEIRDRTTDTQFAAIASLVASDPEAAVETYRKTADFYLRRLERSEEGDDIGEHAETLDKYSSFGAEMATLAEGLQSGTTTVRELVQRATQHHRDVLQDVRERVPEEARAGIDRALENQERIRAPEATEQATDPSDFAEEKRRNRPRDEFEPNMPARQDRAPNAPSETRDQDRADDDRPAPDVPDDRGDDNRPDTPSDNRSDDTGASDRDIPDNTNTGTPENTNQSDTPGSNVDMSDNDPPSRDGNDATPGQGGTGGNAVPNR